MRTFGTFHSFEMSPSLVNYYSVYTLHKRTKKNNPPAWDLCLLASTSQFPSLSSLGNHQGCSLLLRMLQILMPKWEHVVFVFVHLSFLLTSKTTPVPYTLFQMPELLLPPALFSGPSPLPLVTPFISPPPTPPLHLPQQSLTTLHPTFSFKNLNVYLLVCAGCVWWWGGMGVQITDFESSLFTAWIPRIEFSSSWRGGKNLCLPNHLASLFSST